MVDGVVNRYSLGGGRFSFLVVLLYNESWVLGVCGIYVSDWVFDWKKFCSLGVLVLNNVLFFIKVVSVFLRFL